MKKLASYLLLLIYGIFIALAIFHLETSNASEPNHVIRIAIIDDGYDIAYARTINAEPLKICPTGSYDFSTGTNVVAHSGRHGTLVGSIIAQKLKALDYCAVVYKVFESNIADSKPSDIIRALVMALNEGFTAINMSYVGGTGFILEEMLMKRLSADGVKMFVAAGNSSHNLDKECNAFPACYKGVNNMTVVEATKDDGSLCRVSNYGSFIRVKELGTLNENWGEQDDVCATSFATPRALSAYVLSLHVPSQKQTITPKPKAVCKELLLDTKAGTVTCRGT